MCAQYYYLSHKVFTKTHERGVLDILAVFIFFEYVKLIPTMRSLY